MSEVRLVRIFVSSPGDVSAERRIAQEVIDAVQFDPRFVDRFKLVAVAWDSPHSSTPLTATTTPQDAVNRGMPMPSDCDLVIVVFWSRMGSPLPFPKYQKADGTAYLSGTEWEYEDGVRGFAQHGKPEVVVYRRTEIPDIKLNDPDRVKKMEQWDAVETFFQKLTSGNERGYNAYEKPDDFRRLFTQHLINLLEQLPVQSAKVETASKVEYWTGSPFPGLRAFTEPEAPIYFGRGRETDELVNAVSRSRFVMVVGASGSGKSSLVAAGLIPRLRAGGKTWFIPRFTPAEDPSQSLVNALSETIPAFKTHLLRIAKTKTFAAELQSNPDVLMNVLNDVVKDGEVLFFIDQFEELFTLSKEGLREPFSNLLTRLPVVATLRADFYHRCLELSFLPDLLREDGAHFALGVHSPMALHDMIVRPAERAALHFEAGLVDRILTDTGSDPGALALMAYVLDELYRISLTDEDGVLTFADYDELGGVQGAIGKRAELVFTNLSQAAQEILPRVFHELVEVDERGVATRKRARYDHITKTDAAKELVDTFVDARLLTSNDYGAGATVEVGHEALLRKWERLAKWLEETQEDLRLLRKVRLEAEEWDKAGRPEYLLWKHERLEPVYRMQRSLEPELEGYVLEFIVPEVKRLRDQFFELNIQNDEQSVIVRRLMKIGEPSLEMLCEILGSSHRTAFNRIPTMIEQYLSTLPVMPERVLELLKSDNIKINKAASTLLRNLSGFSSAELLLPTLEHSDGEVRSNVIAALGDFGETAVIPSLLPFLKDEDNRVRAGTVKALGKLGDQSLVSSLLPLLKDEDSTVRSYTIETLGKLGDKSLMPSLLPLIKDENGTVISHALETLGKLGDKSLVPSLVPLLGNTSQTVKLRTLDVLIKLEDKSIVSSLFPLLGDEDSDVRSRAVDAIVALGDRSLVSSLLPLLEESTKDAKVSIIDALGKLGDSSIVSTLLELLNDKDDGVRLITVYWLGKLADSSEAHFLRPLLQDENDEVKAVTAFSLGRLGETSVIPIIIKILKQGIWDDELLEEVAQVLEQFGTSEALEAVAYWRQQQVHKNESREAIKKSYRRVGRV